MVGAALMAETQKRATKAMANFILIFLWVDCFHKFQRRYELNEDGSVLLVYILNDYDQTKDFNQLISLIQK